MVLHYQQQTPGAVLVTLTNVVGVLFLRFIATNQQKHIIMKDKQNDKQLELSDSSRVVRRQFHRKTKQEKHGTKKHPEFVQRNCLRTEIWPICFGTCSLTL